MISPPPSSPSSFCATPPSGFQCCSPGDMARSAISPPPTPRRSKRVLSVELCTSVADNLELLTAPSLSGKDSMTKRKLSSDLWSFERSQKTFYHGLNKMRRGSALERLRQERAEEEAYTSADLFTPMPAATSTIGQALLNMEESPTGVMDFICPPLMEDKPESNSQNDNRGTLRSLDSF